MISRRGFLRGSLFTTAGAALGGGLVFRSAQRAMADEGRAAKRFIFIGSSSGCVPDQYWPNGATRFNYSTEPLERHAASVSILRGVSMTNGGDHRPYVKATGSRDRDTHPSIDQLIAQAHRASGYDRPPLVLCGASKNENLRGWLSFGMDGVRVLPEREPARAFATVFGREPSASGAPAPAPSSGPGPRDRVRRAILETVRDDLERLDERLGARERIRLQEHSDAVGRLLARFESGGDAPRGPISGACGEGEGVFASPPEHYLARCMRHMDLIALAFACDERRVASFMMTPLGHDNMRPNHYRGDAYLGGASAVPGLSAADQLADGLPGDLHQSVAHHWASNESFARALAQIHRAEAAVVAYLIDRLQGIPDPAGGSVFDHTAIVWYNEHADPNHGVNAGRGAFPTVIAAGSQMGLDVGGYRDLRGGSGGEVHGRILLSVADRVGAPLSQFGTHTERFSAILA
ncbi:MAG: DUF1552 domain-containing protein [Myxococcales bacterium]|nr:DUF1552 domain-containing protein [Myxococcales bacterium]